MTNLSNTELISLFKEKVSLIIKFIKLTEQLTLTNFDSVVDDYIIHKQ